MLLPTERSKISDFVLCQFPEFFQFGKKPNSTICKITRSGTFT